MDQYLELLDRAVQRQQRTLQVSLTGLALLIAFAEQRGDSVAALLLYGFVVFAAVGLFGLWIGETGRVVDLVLHARSQRSNGGGRPEDLGLFDGELRRTRQLLTWAWLGLEGAGVAAAWLGYHELGLEEATAGPKPDFDTGWDVGFLAACGCALAFGGWKFVTARWRLGSVLKGVQKRRTSAEED